MVAVLYMRPSSCAHARGCQAECVGTCMWVCLIDAYVRPCCRRLLQSSSLPTMGPSDIVGMSIPLYRAVCLPWLQSCPQQLFVSLRTRPASTTAYDSNLPEGSYDRVYVHAVSSDQPLHVLECY